MSKVYLTFSLSFPEASIQKPRGVNEEWLFPKSSCVKVGGWIDGIVGVGFETHCWPEQWRVDIGCCVRLSQ